MPVAPRQFGFPDLPEVGHTYAGFFIEAVLGTGGFATVFRIRHPGFSEPVALKLSNLPLTDETIAFRALREVQILAKMTNDNVVRIFDHGLGADERWYIVMELLVGQELSGFHDMDRPMPPVRALGLAHQAAMGLDEAHAFGIVHRDVKPDNLWVTPDERVKVLDFGLARAFDMQGTIAASATVGHLLIGTPHYAQPEQIESNKLTPAADVYSVAMILYELLCGRTPFFDEPVSHTRKRLLDNPLQWLLAHVERPVISIEHYPEGRALPRELIALLDQALAKDPTRRPATGGALANRLGYILHHYFGAALAATVYVAAPNGDVRELMLLPGRHRIGHSVRCEIRLAANDPSDRSRPLLAVLEWTGKPRFAELRPLGPDAVRLNGTLVARRAAVGPEDIAEVGEYRLRIDYPPRG